VGVNTGAPNVTTLSDSGVARAVSQGCNQLRGPALSARAEEHWRFRDLAKWQCSGKVEVSYGGYTVTSMVANTYRVPIKHTGSYLRRIWSNGVQKRHGEFWKQDEWRDIGAVG
jgi:hypothetical protein